MSHPLEDIAAVLVQRAELAREKLKHSLILSGLLIVLTSCSFATSRDVRAYNACVARHPQETPVCEGPRQAYESEPSAFQASAAESGQPAENNFDAFSPTARSSLAPVRLHPSPTSVVDPANAFQR
jgi:hypothetical protein